MGKTYIPIELLNFQLDSLNRFPTELPRGGFGVYAYPNTNGTGTLITAQPITLGNATSGSRNNLSSPVLIIPGGTTVRSLVLGTHASGGVTNDIQKIGYQNCITYYICYG
jgi:hypothetical protein